MGGEIVVFARCDHAEGVVVLLLRFERSRLRGGDDTTVRLYKLGIRMTQLF